MNITKCVMCVLPRAPGFEPYCLAHGACQDCHNVPAIVGGCCKSCHNARLALKESQKNEEKHSIKKKGRQPKPVIVREVPKSLHEFSRKDNADICNVCEKPEKVHGFFKLVKHQAGGLGPLRQARKQLPVWVLGKFLNQDDALNVKKEITYKAKLEHKDSLVVVPMNGQHHICLPISKIEQEMLTSMEIAPGHWLSRFRDTLNNWKLREKLCFNAKKAEIIDLGDKFSPESFTASAQTIWARTS